jgi:hypothetical protein
MSWQFLLRYTSGHIFVHYYQKYQWTIDFQCSSLQNNVPSIDLVFGKKPMVGTLTVNVPTIDEPNRA